SLQILRPSISTLFPYTTLFRSFSQDLHEPSSWPAPGLNSTYKEAVAYGGARYINLFTDRSFLFYRTYDKEIRQEKLSLLGYFPKDRKSTRLNSSHVAISYAVFC